MTEINRIDDQAKRAFEGPAWHGPSLKEVLSDVTAAEAAIIPAPEIHSIWQLVLHAVCWKNVVTERVGGRGEHDPTPAEDWPTVSDTSAAAWKQTLEILGESQRRLREAIRQLPEKLLNNPVPGRKYTFYGMVQGVLQHDIYHAGQIAILKKVNRR